MGILEKIRLLFEGSRFDLENSSVLNIDALASGLPGEIYQAKSPGGCVPIFKSLVTNVCKGDCSYCANNVHRSCQKVSISPVKLASLVSLLNERGLVSGAFFSSGIPSDPDSMMEKIIGAARILREKYRFEGYLHLKVLPGCSRDAIFEASKYADRLSVNIEAPSALRLSELCSTKDLKTDILRRMRWIERTGVSQTTQFVVGASDESDRELIYCIEKLYNKIDFKRFYFSLYRPVGEKAGKSRQPNIRAQRLYESDFLIRRYGFEAKDIFFDEKGGLFTSHDPKFIWAINNRDIFPINVNEASPKELMMVPGIGEKSAAKIASLRRKKKIKSTLDLAKIGVRVRKAMPFIQIGRSFQAGLSHFSFQ
ncbi:MAG: radical SAM protein [Candidatus Methanofastidiosia archaeon]